MLSNNTWPMPKLDRPTLSFGPVPKVPFQIKNFPHYARAPFLHPCTAPAMSNNRKSRP